MLTKLAVLVALVAGCGNDQVTESAQVIGSWARVDSTASLTIANNVTFDSTLQFTLSFSDGSGATGPFEVNNLYVLLYPVDPANTTWCVPNASLSGDTLKFDDFNSDCDTSPHPPGVQSPLVGAYKRQPTP